MNTIEIPTLTEQSTSSQDSGTSMSLRPEGDSEKILRQILGPSGLELPQILTWEQWEALGLALASQQTALHRNALRLALSVGCWYTEGEKRFGEAAAQAEAISDAVSDAGGRLSPGTVVQYASLYRQFGTYFRNRFQKCSLSIKHLQQVRGLETAEAEEWLDKAQEKDLSSGALRRQVREVHPPQEKPQTETVEGRCLRLLLEAIDQHGCPDWLRGVYAEVRECVE